MASRAERKGMVPEETKKARTTVKTEETKPEGKISTSDVERLMAAIEASKKETGERLAASVKEIQNTIGVHGTRLDRHRKELDDHERRIAALEGKASKTPSEAEKEAEKAGSETGKSETSKPEKASKSESVASPARTSKPGASLPVERRLIEPEEARIIPGCPKDARYEAAYWVCYVQHTVNGVNTERSFVMKDKTSAIQKHNSASKRPHKVYVWLDADGEYLGKLNADALLYLHGAE